MRLTAALIPLLTVGGLQGCAASMEWVRPDTTPEQASFDQQQCRNAAWHYSSSGPWYPWYPRAGWRGFWGGAWGPDPFLEELRLADFCMRVRGYELVDKPNPAQAAQ